MILFGVSPQKRKFRHDYNERFFSLLWKDLMTLRLTGSIVDGGDDNICLTARGEKYWVIVMREFFSAVNNFTDQMRSHV